MEKYARRSYGNIRSGRIEIYAAGVWKYTPRRPFGSDQ